MYMWQILFSWAPKSLWMVTAAMKWKDTCSLEEKHIKKQRHYFANKCPYSQTYGFSSSHVQMWELNHKEGQRIDVFKLWCWRRLLSVPWTTRRSNLSTLKESNPEYSLEGLMLKLKLQYLVYLIWRSDSSEKIVMLGWLKVKGEGVVEDEMVR